MPGNSETVFMAVSIRVFNCHDISYITVIMNRYDLFSDNCFNVFAAGNSLKTKMPGKCKTLFIAVSI